MDGIDRETNRRRISSDVIFTCVSFPSSFDSLRLHSTLLFEQIEANRLAIGGRLREIVDTLTTFSIYFYELFIVKHVRTLLSNVNVWKRTSAGNSKALISVWRHPNTNKSHRIWSAMNFVAFKSFRSVRLKVNMNLISEEFQFYWFFFASTSFATVIGAKHAVRRHRWLCVRAICRQSNRDKWTTIKRFVSFEVKWHSIEMFRLIKTFARTANGTGVVSTSTRITSMFAAAAAATAATFVQCAVFYAI